jgi:hypothetical protein
MEIAGAQIQRPEKGEDAYLVRPLNDNGSAILLAVADGLSLNDGKAAAQWVIEHLRQTTATDNPRAILGELRSKLAGARQADQSETTLTCGIVRQMDGETAQYLRFDYFAIGDSPVWKVIEGDSGSRYPFQRLSVHGPPYPAETARVYATVRLHLGDIRGTVTFGAVEIAAGEVLVVCTDGIPEREVFIRDLNASGEDAPGLCKWLFQQLPYDNGSLAELLSSYERRGVLFDDATIISIRLAPSEISHQPALGFREIEIGNLSEDEESSGEDSQGSVAEHGSAPEEVNSASEGPPSLNKNIKSVLSPDDLTIISPLDHPEGPNRVLETNAPDGKGPAPENDQRGNIENAPSSENSLSAPTNKRRPRKNLRK